MTALPVSCEPPRPTGWLTEIAFDDGVPPPLSPERDQERRVVVFDLLEENSLCCRGAGGSLPPAPRMARRIVSFYVTATGCEASGFTLSLGPVDQAMKDYATVCDSYAEATRSLPPAQIETIDRARRDSYVQSAQLLHDRLSGEAQIGQRTARHLFTLICVLAAEGERQ